LAFLQELQRKSLFSYVNLQFLSHPKSRAHVLLEIMNAVIPLFTNIETIEICGEDIQATLQNEYPEEFKKLLTAARVLEPGSGFYL
jgi:hypothetical protein